MTGNGNFSGQQGGGHHQIFGVSSHVECGAKYPNIHWLIFHDKGDIRMCYVEIPLPGKFNDTGVFPEYGRENKRATCVKMYVCPVA